MRVDCRAVMMSAVLALGVASRGPAAPVPFVGTASVIVQGVPTGLIPGTGTVNVSPTDGSPITQFTLLAGGFFQSPPTGTIPLPSTAAPVSSIRVRNLAISSLFLSQPGTCTASHFGVSCPGGGLAGFGPVWASLTACLFGPCYPVPVVAQPIPGAGVIGGGSTATTFGLVTVAVSGAGWTTGSAVALAGPFTPTTVGTGSNAGGGSLSLVSPVRVVAGSATVAAAAALSMTVCDQNASVVGASCQCDPGFTGSGALGDCAVLPPTTVTVTTSTSTTSTIIPAVGVTAKKLIVIDKLAAVSKAKLVYVAKDGATTKGSGTDAATIAATFDVAYDGETGHFSVPAGALAGGSAGWVVNKATVAKYVNKDDPEGGTPTGVKVAAIKPGKLLKLVAKTLGDGDALDILGQGAPAGSVTTAYCVDNAGEATCHCTEFTGCAHKSIAGGTGAKLVCKAPNAPDGACAALP